MELPTYDEFKQFVNVMASKQPDRKINHHSAWSNCAVGEFMTAVMDPEEVDMIGISCQWAEAILPANVLDNLGCSVQAGTHAKTYGDLAKWLIKLEEEQSND